MALKDKVKQIKQEHEEFEFPSLDELEIIGESKKIISIYGDKNGSKSCVMFSLMNYNDSCLVLSLDGKSAAPLKLPFIKNMNIKSKVVNPMLYYNKTTDDQWLSSAVKTVALINNIIDKIEPNSVDWVCIDCTEVLKELAEIVMRAKYKTGVFGGVNMAYWKERGRIIDNIHKKAFDAANKGVIYTFYPKTDNMLIKDGQVVDSKQTPNWIGNILRETDVCINVKTNRDKSGEWRYIANIEGSKDLFFKEGEYDITNQCLIDVLTVVNDITDK